MSRAIGPGRERPAAGAAEPESAIKRSAVAAHASQMYTLGPATSLVTCAAPLPQNEQANLRRNNIDRPSNGRRHQPGVSRDHYYARTGRHRKAVDPSNAV